MATSILSRKRDLAYFVFFCIGLPMIFLMDAQAIYPPSLVPAFMKDLEAFYINTYNDQFFVEKPRFFQTFIWFELFTQVPVLIWAIPALLRDSPKIPLVLLPYSTLVFFTTAVCMVEYSFWPTSVQHKIDLTMLYGPYLAVSAFMLMDMSLRLNNTINRPSTGSSKRKAIRSPAATSHKL